jgi:hypothetical protein
VKARRKIRETKLSSNLLTQPEDSRRWSALSQFYVHPRSGKECSSAKTVRVPMRCDALMMPETQPSPHTRKRLVLSGNLICVHHETCPLSVTSYSILSPFWHLRWRLSSYFRTLQAMCICSVIQILLAHISADRMQRITTSSVCIPQHSARFKACAR